MCRSGLKSAQLSGYRLTVVVVVSCFSLWLSYFRCCLDVLPSCVRSVAPSPVLRRLSISASVFSPCPSVLFPAACSRVFLWLPFLFLAFGFRLFIKASISSSVLPASWACRIWVLVDFCDTWQVAHDYRPKASLRLPVSSLFWFYSLLTTKGWRRLANHATAD